MNKTFRRIAAASAAGILVFTLASCSVTDKVQSYFNEPESTTVPLVNKTEKPSNIKSIAEYFNRISADVKDQKPGVSMKRELKIDDGSIECDNEILKDSLKMIKDSFLEDNEALKDYLSSSAEKGSDLTAIYPVSGEAYASTLNPLMVKKALCYQDSDYYILKITLEDEANPVNGRAELGKIFSIPNKADVLNELKKSDDYLKVEDYSTKYVNCYIECKVARDTDQLLSATYLRYVEVSANVTGTNSLKSIGTVPIKFTLEQKDTYDLTWVDETTTTAAK